MEETRRNTAEETAPIACYGCGYPTIEYISHEDETYCPPCGLRARAAAQQEETQL